MKAMRTSNGLIEAIIEAETVGLAPEVIAEAQMCLDEHRVRLGITLERATESAEQGQIHPGRIHDPLLA